MLRMALHCLSLWRLFVEYIGDPSFGDPSTLSCYSVIRAAGLHRHICMSAVASISVFPFAMAIAHSDLGLSGADSPSSWLSPV